MTNLLDKEEIKALASEESVRGVLVQKVLERVKVADDEEARLLEEALELLLMRFQALEGSTT